MKVEIINNSEGKSENIARIFLIDVSKGFSDILENKQQEAFFEVQRKRKKDLFYLRTLEQLSLFISVPDDIGRAEKLEFSRKKAAEAYALLKANNFNEAQVVSNDLSLEGAFCEGLILSSYQFDKYKEAKEEFSLSKLFTKAVNDEMIHLLEAVFWARDMVNEPPAHQTAAILGKGFESMASEIEGLEVEVFNKIQIESLRMGGLLSINRGSVQPPTFSILTWKPENAVNVDPIVLVGKGVVYDTGGINLKPTGFLETMKSDMSGAAVVSSVIKAVSASKLPVYVVALIPATDNRPGADAIVPGDVITMMGGKTVEIINTDAEGRMILADGLSYSSKYNPELCISVATLTGSAARTFGSRAFAVMGNAKERIKELYEASYECGERCWELPFWDDFSDELKSPIADFKHLGGINAGAITAGKFLEKFTTSPYIHLDIAGVAFNEKQEDYRPVGGTGVGVRALYNFIKNYIAEKESRS